MTKGIASWGWSAVPQKHLDGPVLLFTQAKIVGGGFDHQRPALHAWRQPAPQGYARAAGPPMISTSSRSFRRDSAISWHCSRMSGIAMHSHKAARASGPIA